MKLLLLALVLASTVFSMASTPATQAAPLFIASIPTGGTWTATGSLRTARISAMAATLPSGKVLVAGGFNLNATLASAELFDPQTGHWSPTGTMTLDRSNATMTLLSNGKVLVAGGLIDAAPDVTPKAELYDPATGHWSRTGAMFAARANHTATLLANGKVLVAGGVGVALNQAVAISSAEVYDPATGSWSRTASMSTPRERHAAARLANGEVLVTGGNLDYLDGPVGSVESYNPTTGRWSMVGRLTTSRFMHTATMLTDGSVLVSAGAYGNFAGSNTLATADRFDPVSRRWFQTGDMQIAAGSIPSISGVENHTATRLADGRVLVAGGDGYFKDFVSNVIFSSAELFNPHFGTWTLTGNMHTARSEHVAVRLLDGGVLVAGGSGVGTPLATAEVYTPTSNPFSAPMATQPGAMVGEVIAREPIHNYRAPLATRRPALRRSHGVLAASRLIATAGRWSSTGSMHVARIGAPATLLPNGKVLVEGCDLFGPSGATAELYDPVGGTWSMTGSMHAVRCGHSAILLRDGRVLVAGGYQVPNVWSSAEIYNPSTGRWTLAARMNSTRQLASIAMLANGEVLVAAGAAVNDIPRDSADLFRPATGTWTATPSLNLSRQDLSVAVLPTGKVLVEGGFTQNSAITMTSEIYDPVANLWTPTGSTEQQSLRMVALANGKLLSTDEPGNGPTGTTSELYSEAAGKWTPTLGKMHFPRANDAVTRLADGRVIVSGGCFGLQCVFIAQAEIFHPTTQTWSLDAPLSTPREVHSAVLLANGRVLVAGGYDANLNPLTSAEIFTPGATSQLQTLRRL